MIDINAIIRDAERCCALEKTELYMPTVASFLMTLSKRYGGAINRNECGSVARSLMRDADKNDANALYELGLCYYLGVGAPYDDAEAARAAERDGVRLVYGIPFVEDGVYVDTPENRAVLERYSRKIKAAIRRRESANV